MAKITTKTGAHISLPAIIEFNKDLVKFKGELENFLQNINLSVAELAKSHQDEKFEEFKIEFEKYSKLLKPLADELGNYKEFAEKNWIPKIEEYLKTKRQ